MASLETILSMFPTEARLDHHPRPYMNHSVEFKRSTDSAARFRLLQDVGFNVFSFPADYVSGCDLLSDSGTTTMTSEQWAALHLADEAYGSNRGYFQLRDQIRATFGSDFFSDSAAAIPNGFLFHQGRSAEDALYSQLAAGFPGGIVVGNGHFDTTIANMQGNGLKPVSLFSDELKERGSEFRFKGNIHLDRLDKMLKQNAAEVALILMTITNNTGGGQPVSMQNIRSTAELARHYRIPFFIDACRFAENAWFIQNHEEGYAGHSIAEIVHDMFQHADGFTISFKKDGLANMGGGLFLKENGFFSQRYPGINDALFNYQILKEGHPTYGGLSGRDILTIAHGLRTVTRSDYLTHRVRQVQKMGDLFRRADLPVVTPIGGHAIYLDMDRFFEGTSQTPSDFGGIAFTALLLGLYGHRACELGHFAFGQVDPATGEERFPEVNFVRFAIPRLRYESDDLAAVAAAAGALYAKRDAIPAARVVHGRNLPLRHFKARFDLNGIGVGVAGVGFEPTTSRL